MIWVWTYITIGLAIVPWRNLTPRIWPIEILFHTFLWPATVVFWLTMLIIGLAHRNGERRLREENERG